MLIVKHVRVFIEFHLCEPMHTEWSYEKLTLIMTMLCCTDECDGPDTCNNHGACLGIPRRCICDVGYQLSGFYGRNCEGKNFCHMYKMFKMSFITIQYEIEYYKLNIGTDICLISFCLDSCDPRLNGTCGYAGTCTGTPKRCVCQAGFHGTWCAGKH